MMAPPRLIVGISGATGAIYGIRLLEVLADSDVDTHLVMSRNGRRTVVEETDYSVDQVQELATVCHPAGDMGAAISSGSFRTLGMVVAPCAIRSLAEIADGSTTGLLTRAADVTLKERRRLVLLVRETPLREAHLRAMTAVTRDGGIVMPPLPAFYTRPATIAHLVDHTVGRVLDLFDIDHNLVERWGEPS